MQLNEWSLHSDLNQQRNLIWTKVNRHTPFVGVMGGLKEGVSINDAQVNLEMKHQTMKNDPLLTSKEVL